ncbi:GNAT family N-acetyltransferase [Magnetovibrio sp.]|uniref:GNAT family N-acetyltransferase n=1 Tax=Magnetovibrio sp. TaxID=2024836 RepID=UPI002F9247F6
MARAGADSEKYALGFLPPNAFSQAAEQGKLLVAINDSGEFLGHLMYGGVFPHCKVMQIYSVPAFRKLGIAQLLMEQLVDYAQERGYLSLSAKVANDLDIANQFYERMGFQIVGTRPGGKTRNRLLYYRVRDLGTPSLFDFMSPQSHGTFSSLGISGGYSSTTPMYAIDLNVLFDVGKKRMRSRNAGMVFKASFRNDVRLVIAQEFIEELKRTSQDSSNDPYLELALQMNVLPMPRPKEIGAIEKKLAALIFPERHTQNILKLQDKSDVRHLATAIHHNAAGFITSENAILRAHDHLRSEYGLDILGVSDFSDTESSNGDDIPVEQIAQAEDTELTSNSLTAGLLQETTAFLKQLHVPKKSIDDAISQGDAISPQRQVILRSEAGIVSFSSWTMVQNPRPTAKVFLCADENVPAAATAIEHTLNRICKTVSSNTPARVRLNILPGNPITRKAALAHGFRPEPGKEEHGTTLHKVALGTVVSEKNWDHMRRALRALADVELPQNIPQFDDAETPIEIKNNSGETVPIPLRELETLLSPTLIILPGRPAAAVSIKRVFADELLGTADQLSLLTPPEAVLLKERVYYNTPRAVSILAPGTPILFYESAEAGGRKGIVAVGRATESHILTYDQVNSDMKRKGVLDEEGLKRIGNSETKLVTAFDNIMPLKNSITLKRLREIGCADGANFITAKRIKPDHLIMVINEGLQNE